MLQVTGKLAALKGLDARLKEIRSYLDLVIEGKLPLNHEILYHLQVFVHSHLSFCIPGAVVFFNSLCSSSIILLFRNPVVAYWSKLSLGIWWMEVEEWRSGWGLHDYL